MARSSPLPPALRDRAFTVAEASALGVSPWTLEGPACRLLFRGVHASADLPLHLVRWLQAAMLVLPPDSVVASLTGLHARGVLVGAAWPLRFVTRSKHQVRRRGLQVSRSLALPPHRERLASAEHCFVSACAELDLVDAVAAGDWLVHLGHTTVEELAAYAAGFHGPGAPTARRAVLLVRERVESPRETYLRLLLVLAGLPEARCNLVVGTRDEPIGRGDLVYDEHGLVVEYDGRQHADGARQWNRDLDRLDAFGDSRWEHIRVTSVRLRRPRVVVQRVHARLVARGYTGVAPTFRPEWVTLFETRAPADRARGAPNRDSWSTCPTGGSRPR